MKIYFTIQFRRLWRGIQAFGLSPYAAIPIALIAFIVVSVLLFKRSLYAPYIYAALPLLLVFPLGNTERNSYLKMLFTITSYRQVRLAENLLSAIPFVVFLLVQQQYLLATAVLPGCAALSLYNKVNKTTRVIPSPFSRHPFEFTTGFRKQYWLVILLYLLTGIALAVDNFNLGLFALAAMVLMCMGFYTTPEPVFYVWIYQHAPSSFLRYKIITALRYSLALCLPAALLLTGYYPGQVWIIALLLVAAALNITMSVAVKYYQYPQAPGLFAIICITAGLLFPPVLLVLIPYFLKRAQQRLIPYLT